MAAVDLLWGAVLTARQRYSASALGNDPALVPDSLERVRTADVTDPSVGRSGRRLSRTQRVERPRAEVFEFFSNPKNLERITPPSLRFRILTPHPIAMRVGTLIDYRLLLHGIPIRWRTRIEAYDPPLGFTDVQLIGPYVRWVHRHEFAEVAGGTEVRDQVDYELPFSVLEEPTHRLLVRPWLERIFDYRHAAILKEFPT